MFEDAIADSRGVIADHGDAEAAHSHVGRGDDLENRRHTDQVGSDRLQHSDLGRGFVARSRNAGIDALLEIESELGRELGRPIPQGAVIGLGHVGEQGTPGLGEGAGERIRGHQVDVVLDRHQVARQNVRQEAAGGVGHEQRSSAQQGGEADVEDGLRGVVALIGMDPPSLVGHRLVPLTLQNLDRERVSLYRLESEGKDLVER